MSSFKAENAVLRSALATRRRTAAGDVVRRIFNGGSGGGGGAGAVADYNKASVGRLVVQRGGWLGVFLLSLSLTSVAMSGFEHTLAEQIELAYFVPLLIGHGGNAGGQTVGTVLGAMSAGQVAASDWVRVVGKEMLAGLGAGTLTCGAMLPLLFGMKISRHVSVVILVTLPVLTVRGICGMVHWRGRVLRSS